MRNQLRLLRDVSALILIACTWRLWFAASDFPAVPFFEFLTAVPRIVDPVLSGVLVAALLVDAFLAAERCLRGGAFVTSVRIEQVCDRLFIAMAVGLVLLNQHCLQPWMYHFLILTPLLWLPFSKSELTVEEAGRDKTFESTQDQAFSRTTILWLTSSIYVWSAWSKIDASFLQTHGPKFVGAICDAVGISTRFWTDRTWQVTASFLPAGELLVGVSLLFRRTRSFGILASILMHVLLIVAVGPWGLNHRAGVLLWNGFFIVQNIVLLRAVRDAVAEGGYCWLARQRESNSSHGWASQQWHPESDWNQHLWASRQWHAVPYVSCCSRRSYPVPCAAVSRLLRYLASVGGLCVFAGACSGAGSRGLRRAAPRVASAVCRASTVQRRLVVAED